MASHDVGEVEAAAFARHLRVEHDLEQKVAELVLELVHVFLLDRIRHLVSFLDGVGGYGLEALFAVPRAAVHRIAQPDHDVEQVLESG